MEQQAGAKEDEKNYSVPNLERALAIIELLTNHPRGLTLAELKEKLGFPKSSLFRITQTLIDRNYLVRCDQPSRFTLSKKFLHIGLSTLSETNLVENCLPIMRQLRDKLKETVLLGALIDGEGILLDQVIGLHPFTFILKAGKRFNLHASAPGKSVVAFLPDEERKSLIDSMPFERYNNNTIITADDYQKELEEVNRNGYGIDHAEELDGVHCVGAPIFNQFGYPIAALWVTAPSMRLPVERFQEVGCALKEACMSISKQYGYKIS